MGREGNMESKPKEGIVCFNEKEADEHRQKLEEEGYREKIVKMKDGRYIVYSIGERWERQY